MATKKQKYFIVTDENNRPMAWSREQLCYCNDETWQDKPHVLVPYTEARARKFIERSKAHRVKYNLSETKYRLMPIKLPNKFESYNK